MEQFTIFNDVDNTSISALENKDKSFSACFQFRQCSEQGKCLRSDADSLNCFYRKNLEQGLIFYGKTATGFDMKTYEKLSEIYSGLSVSERDELNCLIIYFEKHRSSTLWYKSAELVKLENLGLIHCSISPKFVLQLCTLSFLKTLLDADTAELLKEQIKERENNKNARIKKTDIIDRLVDNPSSACEAFINKFAYVSFPNELHRYIFELFHDFIVGSEKKYQNKIIERLPQKCEQNFIKSKERAENDF